MARRYRYSFTRKKEAPGGIASVVSAALSLMTFVIALICSVFTGVPAWLPGGFCLLGALLSVYGFLTGLISFSGKDQSHKGSLVGSMASGLMMIFWLGMYLGGR